MVCTRKTKTLVSTCVILSGMTNIICLLYVGWVTNYIASVYVRGQEPAPDKKLEEDKGDTLKIIERLDHLENVIKQHIQGTDTLGKLGPPSRPGTARSAPGRHTLQKATAGSLGSRLGMVVVVRDCTLRSCRCAGPSVSAAVHALAGLASVRGALPPWVCAADFTGSVGAR